MNLRSQKGTDEIKPGLLGSKDRALIAAVVKNETSKEGHKDREALDAPRDDRHHSDAGISPHINGCFSDKYTVWQQS